MKAFGTSELLITGIVCESRSEPQGRDKSEGSRGGFWVIWRPGLIKAYPTGQDIFEIEICTATHKSKQSEAAWLGLEVCRKLMEQVGGGLGWFSWEGAGIYHLASKWAQLGSCCHSFFSWSEALQVNTAKEGGMVLSSHPNDVNF